ncbi:MAG TPA: cation:proton antiporter family protein [Kineobactrum sp.]
MIDLAVVHSSQFYEWAALLSLAAAVGFIGLQLRQPMVGSFIAVGILAGPSVLDLVQTQDNIDLMAELGIAVLLFLVGLKLDLKLVRSLGLVALATGLGQVLFTSVFGFLLARALGMTTIVSIYVAVALTFSSTIIIVKLLSDKREVDSLHGRIAIGFLIVQDLVVVLAMMLLSSVGVGADDADRGALGRIVGTLANGVGMLVFVLLFIRYLATPLVKQIAYSPELMVTFTVAWAALFAAAGHYLGFSKELGGLLAGVSLASTPYREAIVSRLGSLRDFLLLFFFIALGAKLDLGLLGAQIGPAMVFSVFVLVGNPLIVMVILGVLGYRKRTGFLAGLTVAQISEFSLIFMAMGMTLGHVDAEALGLVTLVGLITIATSVYMITWSHVLYRLLERVLGIFERSNPTREKLIDEQPFAARHYDVILFGLGRYGRAIARFLLEHNLRILVVDFNPEVVKRWREDGGDAVFGDASNQEFLALLPLDNVKWVVSALPQHDLGITHEDPRLLVLNGLKERGYKGRIALSSHYVSDVEGLKDKGADLV